jgi:hypothetical protein
MQERVKVHNMHVSIYSPPTSEYLAEDIVIRANGLLEEAERLADEPRIKKRVKIARLPIRYVMIERNFLSDEERKGVIADFFDTAAKAGISNINEWTTMGQYKEKLAGPGK